MIKLILEAIVIILIFLFIILPIIIVKVLRGKLTISNIKKIYKLLFL